MEFLTILAFFLIPWSYGFALLRITKSTIENHPVYQFIAELGAGYAVFSFLGIILDPLHIPLHVGVYIAIGMLYPVWALVRSVATKEKRPKSKPADLGKIMRSRETYIILLLLIVSLSFFAVYHKGAFAYPYLEDDDPWEHVLGIKYVADTQTYDQLAYFRESGGLLVAAYLEPYPPTYDIVLALLHQFGSPLSWVAKFFNAAMAALTLVFMFLFAREFFKDDAKAIFTVIVLAVLPSFMSHFIWSQTLALMLVPVGLYAVLRALTDKSWRIPAIIVVASNMVTQPVVSFVFGLVVIFLVALLFAHEFLKKKRLSFDQFPLTVRGFVIGAAGLALSLLFWGYQMFKWTLKGIWQVKGEIITGGWGGAYSSPTYTLSEVFFPPSAGRIDQAIGWGPVAFVMLVLAVACIVLLRRKTLALRKDWRHALLLVWFATLLYGVFAATWGLPDFGSSRWWAYLAIPLAMLVAEGTFIIAHSMTRDATKRLVIAAAVVLLIALTSAPAKVTMQTSNWPPGVHWVSEGQLRGYVQMQQELPQNHRVMTLCGEPKHVIGFDQVDPLWEHDTMVFRSGIANRTGEEIVAFLDQKGYQYIVIDASCITKLGPNVTQDIGERLSGTGRFSTEISMDGFILARKA